MTKPRREFLKTTSRAAAIALATPLGLAARPSAKPVASNDQIRIGLIGCNGMGFFDLKNHLKQPGVECGGLCDVDEEVLNAKAAETEEIVGKKPKLFKDFRQMLDDPEIDAVVIGTPDHWHCLQTVMACQAGKDVYVEKPMANSIAESAIMVEAAKKYNRIVQVGQQQRSGKHWAEVVGFVQSGKLGKIRQVKVWAFFNYGSGQPRIPDEAVPKGLDFEMWLGPAPERPFNRNRFHGNWRHQWHYGGGLMTDWGVHLLDIVIWAMEIKGAPNSVQASGGIFASKDREIETADTMAVLYQHDDFIVTWEQAGGIQEGLYDRLYGISFIGANGTLVVNRSGWEVLPEEMDGKYKMEAMPKQSGQGSNHELHAINFIESIKSRKEPVCTVKNGYDAAFYAHLGNIAYRTHSQLAWDESAQRFKNNSDADALLTPNYRKPWELPKV